MSKQKLSNDDKKRILKLLEIDLTIDEVFDIIKIPISHHWYELKHNKTYKKRVNELKVKNYGFTKYQFLINYLKNKKNLEKTRKQTTGYNKISNLFKYDDEFLYLFEKIKLQEDKISNKISKYSIPDELVFHYSDDLNKKFYDSKNTLVNKYCSKCSGYFDVSHYHRNKSNKDGYSNYCIICTSNMNYGRDPHKRGELHKNKIIKKYNSVAEGIL